MIGEFGSFCAGACKNIRMKFIRLPLLFIFCVLTALLFLRQHTNSIFLFMLGTVMLYVTLRFIKEIYDRFEFQKNQVNTKDEYLNELLHEKNWLLQEIQHRVKNNLQIVMSLLNSQSNYLKDESALQAIRDCQNRVYSMSLIHQKIYQPGSFASVAMHVYINELVAHLQDSFGSTSILFSINADEIFLTTSQATPIGLIINEAVTNAIKYAFTDSPDGTIEITFRKMDEKRIEIKIVDNGSGLPHDFDMQNTGSLGMNLIKGLTEDIDGDLSIYNDHGTVIKIFFSAEEFNEIATTEIK